MPPAMYKKLLRARVTTNKYDEKVQNIALLGAAQETEVEEGSDYQGAIVGTSLAVLGAAAAIFAARRCQKKDVNDFERV